MIKDLKTFKRKLEKLDINNPKEIDKFVGSIQIDDNNFDEWHNSIFSDEIDTIDLNKLPVIIESLYAGNDKFLFVLGLDLLEATYMTLPYITKLSDIPLFKGKYLLLKDTLEYIYTTCFNDVSYEMALIILNNDPKGKYFSKKQKNLIAEATNAKMMDILNYMTTTKKIDEFAYDDLEVLVDLACYMNNEETTSIIKKLEKTKLSFKCKLYITKYKLANNIHVSKAEIKELLQNKERVKSIVRIFEEAKKMDLLEQSKITQEDIATAEMIEWLEYPTELGKAPAEIELIDSFDFNKKICYVFKFKKKKSEKSYYIGIAGGYNKNKLSVQNTGLTFSFIEKMKKDYMKQAQELAEFMNDLMQKENLFE